MEIIAILFSLAFVILRLCKLISWDWLWVFCPIWSLGLIFVAIVLYTSFSCAPADVIDQLNFVSVDVN
jgi:hypothetical protein